ncbi:MAG: signal recognition particle protein [Myxococcales bacterium]|nr:signal recognition particle protein [Myxococcales bacterium]MDH5305749.1 signal recognition particle protein [Myxococcales bacterium]MDH5565894.1 signal recognition particle protein [Myxococcales bacterium]
MRALTEENVSESLRDVRMSLLEADVDLVVVRDFLARVKERALGERVETRVRDASGRTHRVTPGQHFVKTCAEELVALMGPVDASLQRRNGVASVMLVGLQGVGKTTVAGKLARHLQKEGSRPLLVAADVYRPAAVLQLQQLGERLGVPVHVGAAGEAPAHICAAAARRAEAEGFDAIVFDTAGRLAIDDALMQELDEIAAATRPANALLVCDALMGRDAVNVAKAFSERLKLDGLILTKLDGDARGGAALAIKAVTGVPIKFLGTGETLDRLEAFRPEGLASRILGMGDIVGLVRDFEEVVDEKEAEADAQRLLKGRFGLEDLLKQLKMIQKLGPLREVMAKLPMFGPMAEHVEESQLTVVESLIGSMTPDERARPEIIDKSRAGRIARGSGRRSRDVRELVDRFGQMREMMASLGSKSGLLSRVPGFGNLAGAGMPGGFAPGALLGAGTSRRELSKRKSSQKGKRKQARKARRKNRRR